MGTASADQPSQPTGHAEPEKLLDQLVASFRNTAESVIPWFVDQMPRMYFQDTDQFTQLSHLKAIVAARSSDRPIDMTLVSDDGSVWTTLRAEDGPGVLAEIVKRLPMDHSLRSAKVHTSLDGDIVLDTFEFGEAHPFDESDPHQGTKIEQTMEWASSNRPEWTTESIRGHFANCASDYIGTLTPLRISHHHELFERVSGTDGTIVEIEPESDPTLSRITVVFGNARTRTSLERCARLLARHDINIVRAYLDVVKDPPHGVVTYVGFVVKGPDGKAIDPESDLWTLVRKDLTRVKWVHYEVLEMLARNPRSHIGLTEIVLGLANLTHQVLGPRSRFEFTRERILSAVEANFELAILIARIFKKRFDPRGPLSDADFQARAEEITAEIDRTATSETARTSLLMMLDAVRHTLRTNYHVHGRFGFALRLDPSFLQNEERPELPFGIFFVHGRGFNGFHVRFQDIARGGLRVVMPRTEAQHARENERLYDEVYGLSFAQQLKNKDIPEGGAKAAILLEPGAGIDRCVKAFVNSILDLITEDPETKAQIVDRSGVDELIYLGPDENITPAHIQWIVQRARRRGYSLPTAFMSSKPGAGINHKVYGVTSEGVNVFLEVALRSVGIDPATQPFTVKITGGPDGDVAGNMIRILDRDYGGNARVVGIGDGSGSGEDPDGLDTGELMRLFEESLPIAEFNPAKLGPRGRIASVEEPDGAQLRNTLHNRVEADAFVPAGGRPATIHAGNWKDFLLSDGTPSSKVISEGANLFLTPEAREHLSAAGCVIIKDSSANKCGVICSSFEIGACMMLEEEEFLRIKPVFVEQVLDRLRSLARVEAELLIAEHLRHPKTSLPQLSIKLSRIINNAAPAIMESIPSWPEEDMKMARQLVLDHLPPILVETGGERVWTKLPERYLHGMMAKRLASGMAYREGIDFLDGMEPPAMASLAQRYLREDVRVRNLVSALSEADFPDRDRVIKLLMKGGVRAGLGDA